MLNGLFFALIRRLITCSHVASTGFSLFLSSRTSICGTLAVTTGARERGTKEDRTSSHLIQQAARPSASITPGSVPNTLHEHRKFPKKVHVSIAEAPQAIVWRLQHTKRDMLGSEVERGSSVSRVSFGSDDVGLYHTVPHGKMPWRSAALEI